MTDFFEGIPKIKYEGPESDNEFAYRHYNADEVIMGKRMEDHLRFSIAYWHSFAYEGGDPFGGRTFERPWYGSTMDLARLKADAAFEMSHILDAPLFAPHDCDDRPEGDRLAMVEDSKSRAVLSDSQGRLAAMLPTEVPGWLQTRYEDFVGTCGAAPPSDDAGTSEAGASDT